MSYKLLTTKAFLLGTVAGTVAGMLFAPRKGSDTRHHIKHKATDTKESLKHKAKNIKQSAENVGHEVKDSAQDSINKELDKY